MITLAATAGDLLYPLSLFCQEQGRALPEYELIDGAEMPEPYRGLLVHRGDMTSRLEEFHHSPMHLRVLHREVQGDAYRREVLLCTEGAGTPVEYGAIEIDLEAFDAELRELILAGRQPLGGLLNTHGLQYFSEPRAFFRLPEAEEHASWFGAGATGECYGRCNLLRTDAGLILARIVEVLRPEPEPAP